QPTLAGGIGQRLDAAVILVMAAVERRLGNALFLGRLGDLLADHLRRLDVAARLEARSNVGNRAARRSQRDAGQVVDELGVNVLRAAEDGQPRPLGGADGLAPDVIAAAQPA